LQLKGQLISKEFLGSLNLPKKTKIFLRISVLA